jgi:hypothetical protein
LDRRQQRIIIPSRKENRTKSYADHSLLPKVLSRSVCKNRLGLLLTKTQMGDHGGRDGMLGTWCHVGDIARRFSLISDWVLIWKSMR